MRKVKTGDKLGLPIEISRVLLIGVTLSACGTYEPEYFIYDVPVIFLDDVGPSHDDMLVATDIIFDYVAENTDKYRWNIEDAFGLLNQIFWNKDPIRIGNKLYNGIYLNLPDEIGVRFINNSIVSSAYCHELMHHLGFRLFGHRNENHDNDFLNGLETKIKAVLQRGL